MSLRRAPSPRCLAGIVNCRPCRAVFFLRFSKKVLVRWVYVSNWAGGGAPGNHSQGLRSASGTWWTGSPDGGPRQSSRERSTLRRNEGTTCDLRSITWQARLGLTFGGTCVIPRSSMKSWLPCLLFYIYIYTERHPHQYDRLSTVHPVSVLIHLT